MGRPGIWDWMSDISNSRAGYFVWDILQLDCRAGVLGIKNIGVDVI